VSVLRGNTWTQAADEDDVVFGAITYQSPPFCTTQFGAHAQLSVSVFVDGAFAGTLVASDLARPAPRQLSRCRSGHSSIQITLDRYGHLMPGNEDEAVALVDAYLERATVV
jgi:hypothetical protein